MLPGIDGLELTRRFQADGIPVILVTARSDEVDRLVGLEIGADDYITKPFSPREVVARVKAVLRRCTREQPGAGVLRVGDLTLDHDRREVRLGDEVVDLTRSEFDILATMAAHPGRVYTRLQLLEAASGDAFDGYERTVDAHIKNIRRKLGEDPKSPRTCGRSSASATRSRRRGRCANSASSSRCSSRSCSWRWAPSSRWASSHATPWPVRSTTYLATLPTPAGGMHMGRGRAMLGAAEQTFVATVDQSVYIGAFVAIAIAAVAALLLARYLSRPMRQLETAAENLAAGDLSHRVEIAGPAEVAALGDAFNSMADSLEEAEILRRRLVADVAHELRNPIAAARHRPRAWPRVSCRRHRPARLSRRGPATPHRTRRRPAGTRGRGGRPAALRDVAGRPRGARGREAERATRVRPPTSR